MSNKNRNKVGLLLIGLLMTAHAAAQPLQQPSVNATGPHAQAASQISVAATSVASAPSAAVQVTAAGRQEPNNQNASTLSNTSGIYTMMAASLGLVGFVIHRRRRIYER